MRIKTWVILVAIGLASVLAASSSGNAAAHNEFRVSSLKGSYAAIFSGKIMGTGLFVSDGKGNLTGHETFTIGSKVCEANIKGTYTVNPDGTGTDSLNYMPRTTGCEGQPYTQSLVIADSGKLVLLSNTNGDQVNEEWHLQK